MKAVKIIWLLAAATGVATMIYINYALANAESYTVTATVPYNGQNMPVVVSRGGSQLETYNPQQVGLNK